MDETDSILHGVEAIPQEGTPGRVIVFGSNAKPVFTGKESFDVIIASATFGKGRVLVFTHTNYVKKFSQDPTEDYKVFIGNARNWVSSGKFKEQKEILNLVGNPKIPEDLDPYEIILWGGQGIEAGGLERIKDFVNNGKGLITGMCPWGYCQLNPGKTFEDTAIYPFLDELGLYYTEDYIAGSPGGYSVENNNANEAHCGEVLSLLGASGKGEVLDNITLEMLEVLAYSYRKLPDKVLQKETCQEISMAVLKELNSLLTIPSQEKPVKYQIEKAVVVLYNTIANTYPKHGDKLPGISLFPGDFEQVPELNCASIRIGSSTKDVYPTGYYLPAGVVLKVQINEKSGGSDLKWKVLIGCHTDDLSKVKKHLTRWPSICSQCVLEEGVTDVCSKFGGLIYFESPDKKSSISARIENVVEAPRFDLENEYSVSNWTDRRNAQGLWADLSGKFITFTMPSSSIRDLDNPSEILRCWDEIVCAHHHVRGSTVESHRREWVVADMQPSAGYMHAGYPVVTHLDVADPSKENFLLSIKRMKAEGFWGLFHEIGHNMQRSSWTFDGTSEVTVNIFTLHAMNMCCGHRVWLHSWLERQINLVKKHLKDGASFENWKKRPEVGLFIYAQLAEAFGWNAYKEVFLDYEEHPIPRDSSHNQGKMDQWMMRFSKTVKHNMLPLFEFWNIPISEEAKGSVTNLPPFLPDDDVTKEDPQRVEELLSKYPVCVRIPGQLCEDNIALNKRCIQDAVFYCKQKRSIDIRHIKKN